VESIRLKGDCSRGGNPAYISPGNCYFNGVGLDGNIGVHRRPGVIFESELWRFEANDSVDRQVFFLLRIRFFSAGGLLFLDLAQGGGIQAFRRKVQIECIGPVAYPGRTCQPHGSSGKNQVD